MVLNGAIGAKLHIPFSIAIRASFGYYLAYFCIISRAVLAMFWLGIQSANGAQCITIMIQSIWPSYGNIKNHIAPGQGITTQGMIRLVFLLNFFERLLTNPVTSCSGSSNFLSS
jgi:NCS1 family nucleobase:cation symporter-1